MNKKNILILGSNSFIARSILPSLIESYNVTALSKAELNLTSFENLRFFFNKQYFNFVINTAISGGGRLVKKDSTINFYENLLMQENLLFFKDHYDKLITFGSGAQEDRRNDILELKEEQFGVVPLDYYSLAKYINSKRVIGNHQVINIKIFNCFGELEKPDRFIYNSIKKYIDKKTIEIWRDCYFDFFYYKDLITIIKHFINNPPSSYFELNAVYWEKKKLSEIVDIINNLDDYKVEIVIKQGINRHYTGSASKIERFNFNFIGLERGIREVYNKLK